MKLSLRILKIVGKGLLWLVLSVVVFLIAAVLVGRKDLGSPGMITSTDEKILITNVNLVPMDSNRLLMNKTVLVEAGIIRGIYDELPELSGFQVIEGEGKYLTPGLMDAHAHIFDRSDLALNLSQGVTTVRNMMGFPMHLRWRDQVNQQRYPGATMFTAGPTLNMGSDTGGPFHKVLSDTEEARKVVEEIKEDGYDFVKVYDGLSEEVFLSIMEAAKKQGLQVAGHPPRGVDIETLTNSGLLSIEHAEEVFQGLMNYKYSAEKVDSIAKILADKRIYVTPSLIIYNYLYRTMQDGRTFMDSIPQEYINPFIRFVGNKQLGDYLDINDEGRDYSARKYAALVEILTILHANEVPLLLGTDAGPNLTVAGYILHSEIALWKQAGIEDFEILKAATINVASALGIDNERGTIEVGKQADFVLVNENPLEDARNMRNLYGVFHLGQWYDAQNLSELEEVGKDKSSWFSTIGRFTRFIISK